MKEMFEFVVDTYGDKIKDYLQTTNISFSFAADSERAADEIILEKENLIKVGNFNIKTIQDYSFGDENVIGDIAYCKIDGKKYIKLITPFIFDRSYDFIIVASKDASEVVNAISKKLEKGRKEINFDPLVGIDVKSFEKETIDFLLNEEFREYCNNHRIKLKRGIIFEGPPGVGKSITLKWIKNKADENDIYFRQFSSIDDFVKNSNEYYTERKKIFVFEDFDAALMERMETGNTPNQVLGRVLNTLEGVNEINNVISIFTTNNIDVFDKAFIRPGRIDKVFRFSLPTEKEYKEFFELYIPEEKEFFDDMVKFLLEKSANISYAVLKGISDDINIFKFSGEKINIKNIFSIIDEKLTGSNKNSTVKDYKDYIL